MAHREPSVFGVLLRRSRLNAGLTQEELAERAQTSARTISDVERGIVRVPQSHIARQLADALELSLAARRAWEEAIRSSRALRSASPVGSPGATEGREAPGPPQNLPIPSTPFVGRTAEKRVVGELLRRDDVRLLTLTGPGGTGKTRLAIEAAGCIHGQFDDGLIFVPLGSVADPAQVPATIRRTMGIEEDADACSEEVVQAHLQNRHVLLILDTFEHLLPASPTIAALLARCPRLKVLVTSRVPLHLSGEHHFSVPSMALPSAAAETTPEEIERHDATSLFVQRARAIDAHFAVTAQNAPIIRGVCARLDGLPLAIELAAARVSVLPLGSLLHRLSDRLPLLSKGARDAPPRQQTMRATIDWSYRLLDGAEQRLLAGLSVFVGGCTVEAAQVVCGTDDHDVFERLSSLVESSLVRVVEGMAGEPRFLLLDTIHEYATEKLRESGEAELVARLHAEYFVNLIERIDQEWERFTRDPRHARAERDNLVAALAGMRDRHEGVLGLRLVGALRGWGNLLGLDARPWLAAFESSLPEAPPLTRAGVLLFQWQFAAPYDPEPGFRLDTARIERAVRQVEEAVAIFRRESDPWLHLRGLIAGASAIGYTQLDTVAGAKELAEEMFREGLSLARSLGSIWGESAALRGLGQMAATLRHDYAKAEALIRESLAAETRAGSVWGVGDSLNALGGFAADQGNYARSLELQAANIAHRRAAGGDVHWLQFSKGVTHLQFGDAAGVLSTLRQVQAESRLSDLQYHYRSWLVLLASTAVLQGDVARAARLFGAVAVVWETGFYSMAARYTPVFESYRASAREQLSESDWTALWEEGQAMTLEQAVDYALKEAADTLVMAGYLQPEQNSSNH